MELNGGNSGKITEVSVWGDGGRLKVKTTYTSKTSGWPGEARMELCGGSGGKIA